MENLIALRLLLAVDDSIKEFNEAVQRNERFISSFFFFSTYKFPSKMWLCWSKWDTYRCIRHGHCGNRNLNTFSGWGHRNALSCRCHKGSCDIERNPVQESPTAASSRNRSPVGLPSSASILFLFFFSSGSEIDRKFSSFENKRYDKKNFLNVCYRNGYVERPCFEVRLRAASRVLPVRVRKDRQSIPI